MHSSRSFFAYLGLFLLVLVAFLPMWKNDFVDVDDEWYITLNDEVSKGLSWSGLRWAWTTRHGFYLQPVTWMSLQLDSQIFSRHDVSSGKRILYAAGFHGENLLWHAGSVLLLFGLLRKLTGRSGPSFLVAALFAIHPLRVESVVWAAERKDVLAIFFGLLTVWAYVRYLEKPGWLRYLPIMAAFLVSLLAKPILMTLPCLLLLLDYWPLGRLGGDCRLPIADRGFERAAGLPLMKKLRRLVIEKVPLFFLAAMVAALALWSRHVEGKIVSLEDLPFVQRAVNALAGYGAYLAASFWPVDLAVIYPHPYGKWSVAAVTAGGLVLVLISVLAIWHARRYPWLIVGWAWFVLTLLPVIGFVQGGDQAWADRFSYWPHIGLFIAVVWTLADCAGRLRVPDSVQAAAAMCSLACLGLLTWNQTTTWQNSEVLWKQAIAVTRDNFTAEGHLGKYYFERGMHAEARPHLKRFVELMPKLPIFHRMLGTTYLTLGELKEAREEFADAAKLQPKDIKAWHNLGIAELYQGNPDGAIPYFRKALELQPDSAETQASLAEALLQQGKRKEALRTFESALRHTSHDAKVLGGIGMCLLGEGKLDDAMQRFSVALRINPGVVTAYNGLGIALGRKGDWREAAKQHGTAVRLASQDEARVAKMGGKLPPRTVAPLYCGFAFALHQSGQPEIAAEVYRAATERHPGWVQDAVTRAWLLATHPDPEVRDAQQAFELASQAIQSSDDAPAAALDALAAAEAALGKFSDAARTARRALNKAGEQRPVPPDAEPRQTTLAAAIQQRIRLYEQGRQFIASEPSAN